MTILIAILVFGVIIMIHELGHFLVAKKCHVRVHEFAIGMGPTLLKWTPKGSETKYALRLLPIGGFVSMEGEDEDSDDPNAFRAKPVWQRILIVVAGAVMNLVLGFVVMIIMTSMSNNIPTTTIHSFRDGAVSSQSGLMVNDTILRINHAAVSIDQDIIYEFVNDEDGIFSMTVRRDGQIVELPSVQFAMQQKEGSEKPQLVIDFSVFGKDKTIGSVLGYSAQRTVYTGKVIWRSLLDMLRGRYQVSEISGPVGVVQIIGEASSMGVDVLLGIVAFITINIGVFNLLPLPALDGGRLLFLLVELIRRKPVKPEYEGYVHFAGIILLLGLMVFVTYQDIVRIVQGFAS